VLEIIEAITVAIGSILIISLIAPVLMILARGKRSERKM